MSARSPFGGFGSYDEPGPEGGRRAWPDEAAVAARPAPARSAWMLRRIELWSALKVSLVLYTSLFVVFLAGAVALWVAGRQSGILGNVEQFIAEVGFDTFRFKDADILRYSAVIGPILVVLASLATVAGAALYNLAARIFGGLEVTLVDGEDVRRRRNR